MYSPLRNPHSENLLMDEAEQSIALRISGIPICENTFLENVLSKNGVGKKQLI